LTKLDISVLYVEDEIEIAEEIRFFLKARVKTLFFAKDGLDALELYKQENPDIIITDIQMPRINGLEMIHSIREENQAVPILITSAYNDSNYLMRSLNLSVDAYILKPTNLAELYLRLEKLAQPLLLQKKLLQTNKDLENLNHSLEERITQETLLRTKELTEKQEFLQSIIDGVDEPIMLIETDYSISLMNTSAKKMMNNSAVSNINSPKCYEVIHKKNTPCEGINFECPLKEVVRTKKKMSIIHKRISDTNDADQYLEISVTPLLNKKDEVTAIIKVFRDVTGHLTKQEELEAEKNLMQYHAYYDTLTGLANRTYFYELFKETVKISKRQKSSFRLLFMDMDNFKDINDTYGHDIGDAVLKEFAIRLKTSVRESDYVVRLGGDEFVVLLLDVGVEDKLEKLIQKMLSEIKKEFLIDSHTLLFTCSIGVSSFPQDATDIDSLLKYADTAMYKAKLEGKNTYKIYKNNE
jgi:diguanylate cyclase (GGDEF)-like protein